MNDSSSYGQRLVKYLMIYPFFCATYFIENVINLAFELMNNEEANKNRKKFSELTDKSDPYSAYRPTQVSDLITIEDPDRNLYNQFTSAAMKFSNKKAIGFREVLSVDQEMQMDGKILRKLSLGDYKWNTYEQVLNRVNNLSNGLLHAGLKSNSKIIIYSETRQEWLISALACFRIKAPIVTLYASLGIDAVLFAIKQTESTFLISSCGEQLKKLSNILNENETTLTNLILITDQFSETNLDQFKSELKKKTIRVQSLNEIEALGHKSQLIEDFESPKKNDLALIMYTSGSTGNPKGVMIAHNNILVSAKTIFKAFGKIDRNKQVYIGYLPLAHILELCAEYLFLSNGVCVGYSSPQTLTDASTAIKKGEKGDLRCLNPTMLTAVPAVLERLTKSIKIKLNDAGFIKRTMFEMAYYQKLNLLKRNKKSYILDMLIFRKIKKMVVGNDLNLIVSAGALMAKEVQEFCQVCLCTVIQAYGATETIGCGAFQLNNQNKTEVCGNVSECCELRLVDWAEGGYRPTDEPNPRGEIYIGGETVCMAYYQMPEKTNEDFKIINGVKYFVTGDIGEMIGDTLKIIDRKKDLVKLSAGEYVSLNKVELIIKLLPFVDNCCMVAKPTASYCVCLICPNHIKLIEMLSEFDRYDINNNSDLELIKQTHDLNEKSKLLVKLIKTNRNLLEKLTKATHDHCKINKLAKFETPSKLKFVSEIWLPETNLVTDSLKIKRNQVEKFYKNQIDQLYLE